MTFHALRKKQGLPRLILDWVMPLIREVDRREKTAATETKKGTGGPVRGNGFPCDGKRRYISKHGLILPATSDA